MEEISQNNVEEIKIDEKSKKKKRNPPQTCPIKHSNWFLTINSQKNMFSYSENEKRKIVEEFSKAVREFFNEKLCKHEFMILGGSKQGEKFDLPFMDSRENLVRRITDTQIKFVIEIGPESHKLHSHGMVAVSKRGLNTKLDYNRIREWFKEKLGYEIHFDATLYNDAQKSLEKYIGKAPAV